MDAINDCDKFYHIISTEGIKAHIKRKSSFFPEFKDYNKRIFNHSGKAAVKCGGKNKNKVFILLLIVSPTFIFKSFQSSS